MERNTLIEDLVARAVDDWVSDAEMLDIAQRQGVDDPSDRRTVALGLLAEALLRGYAQIGSVTDDGFSAWSCSPAEATERAALEWLARADPLVLPGEIFWLNGTARGVAAGEEILARET